MKKIIILGGFFFRLIGAKDTNLIYNGIINKKWDWIIKGFKNTYYLPSPSVKYFLKNYEGYINEENIKKLSKGLDEQSKKNIFNIINNINYLISNTDQKLIEKNKLILENEIENQKVNLYIKKIKKIYKLPIHEYEESVFYYKHGINYIKNIINITKGKDCIDCGGYVGDSSIMFNKELNLNKIYCIEPEEKNYNFLLKTIKINNLEGKIIPLKFGVGDKKEKLNINVNGIESCITKNQGNYIINIETVDNLVEKYGILPGIIKWDIEGYEYKSILGTKNTIEKYKPILIISIYHSGHDFFKLKPLIESFNLGYKYKIIKTNKKSPFLDTILLCY